MRNNLSKNWKSIIFYILIPLLLIGSIFLFSSQSRSVDKNYSEIVALFRDNKVSEFELNLNSGELKYKLFSDDKKASAKTYSVPSVSYFLDDIGDYVNDYNKNPNNKDKQIVYNYLKGSNNSIFLSLLPTIILVVIITALSFWMMRKMGSTIGNETNRTLGFGKIKAKEVGEGDNKTTFADVAGCDEEKEEMTELVDYLKQPDKYTQRSSCRPSRYR